MNRISLLLLAVALVGALSAADLHLTPDGAGKRDVTSWENALGQASLAEAINHRLQPGDHLLLGGGEYRDVEVTVSSGGSEGQPKSIVGVDRGTGLPIFKSQWSVDRPKRGKTALRIAPSVSHLVLRHLRIHGYMQGVQAGPSEAAARVHVTFDDVEIDHVRYGYYLSDCDDLQLVDCDVKRYSKHGFRFEQGCDRITVRRCQADCSADVH